MHLKRTRHALVACTAAGAIVLAGCSQQSATGTATKACAPPVGPKEEVKLPADFPSSSEFELTHFKKRSGFLSARGVETRGLEEVYREMRKTIPSLGYEIIGTDYEGFEAEIFFARAQTSQGVVSMRDGPCRGLVTMSVLYDPVDTDEGRKVLDKTRKKIDRYSGD